MQPALFIQQLTFNTGHM